MSFNGNQVSNSIQKNKKIENGSKIFSGNFSERFSQEFSGNFSEIFSEIFLLIYPENYTLKLSSILLSSFGSSVSILGVRFDTKTILATKVHPNRKYFKRKNILIYLRNYVKFIPTVVIPRDSTLE